MSTYQQSEELGSVHVEEIGRCETGSNFHPRPPVNVGHQERLISAFAGGALAVLGLSRFSKAGLIMAGAGAALAWRGISGHCYAYDALGKNTAHDSDDKIREALHEGVEVRQSIVIQRPVEEVYYFWRNLSNLPRFMKHLVGVKETTERASVWKAKGPVGMTVQWHAEIITDRKGEIIAWKSLPGSDVDNAGTVRFRSINANETEINITIKYSPPFGRTGVYIARLFGEEPDHQINSDLKRLKKILEEGEGAIEHVHSTGPGAPHSH